MIRFLWRRRLLFKELLKECVKTGVMRDTRRILDVSASPQLEKFHRSRDKYEERARLCWRSTMTLLIHEDDY